MNPVRIVRAFTALSLVVSSASALAGTDLIINDVTATRRWGTVSGVTGYTFSHAYCNVGVETANVFFNTSQHPVITASIYRIAGGTLEQIGQGFGFHEYCTLQNSNCATCVPAGGACTALGAKCSNTTNQSVAGEQERLGSRGDINPATGVFGWPLVGLDVTGDILFKRVQVANIDFDPALNPAATYFVESRILSPDDGLAGFGLNNATCKPLTVGTFTEGYNIAVSGPAMTQTTAVERWAQVDPAVHVESITCGPGERYVLGSRVVENGNGTWTYTYVLENYSSTQGARSIRFDLNSSTPSNMYFHDVAYHSGDTYDGTDWPGAVTPAGFMEWKSVQSYDENHDANALRWGTAYTFQVTATKPPAIGQLIIGLFAPAGSDELSTSAYVPFLAPPACTGDADGDGDVDFTDVAAVLSSWGMGGPFGDADHDGDVEFSDVSAILAHFGEGC